MRTLKFEDFESYDIIYNNEDKESDQSKHWNKLKEYDRNWYTDFNSICGGSMPKIFARCDSSVLKKLFAELRKPDCKFETYINDLVHSSQFDETPPIKKVSVLLKQTHGVNASSIEELASVTANALSIPTVFNQAIMIDGKEYTLSVDFVKQNETMTPMLFCENLNEYFLEESLDYLDDYLSIFVPNLHKEDFHQIRNDFIPIYFFRKYVIKDRDFCGKNMGILYNEKTQRHSLGPCFDMECSFRAPVIDHTYEHLDADLKTSMQKFPQTTKIMIDRFKKAIAQNKIQSEIENCDISKDKQEAINFVTNNILMVVERYDALTKEHEAKLEKIL